MKKSTIGLLISSGVIFVTGVIGVTLTHNQAMASVTKNIHQVIPYDKEELTIDGANYGHIRIVPTEKKEITLSGELNRLFYKNEPSLILKDNTVSIAKKARAEKEIPDSVRHLPFFDRDYPYIVLKVPQNVTRLTLKNVKTNASELRLKNLVINNESPYIEGSYDNIQSDQITLENKMEAHFDNVRSNQLNIKTTGGVLDFTEGTLKELTMAGENTKVNLNHMKVGNLKGVLNYNARLVLNDFKGDANVTGDDLTVSLRNNVTGNLNFDIEVGDIFQRQEYPLPENTYITTQTPTGDSYINNKKSPSYGQKDAKYQWTFKVEMGDVVLSSPDYDEDSFVEGVDEFS